MSLTFIQEEGDRSRIEILIDEAHTFTLYAYENDAPVALDATATKVQIQHPGGSDLVSKTNTGVTVGAGLDGSTANKVTYTLSAANADTLGERYILTVYAVRNGESTEHERRILFDICKTRLYNVVREEDLFELAPALRTERAQRIEGVANSSGGSATTLVDDRLEEFPDDWFNGGEIELLDGSDAGERRVVTDFARSTGTVTFSPAISAAPDGDTYRVTRSWQHLIDLAFEDVKWRVRQRGNRPALIIDAGELFKPVCYHAIELAYRAIGSYRGETPSDGVGVTGNARAYETADMYERLYDEAFASIPFQYDSSEDAVPDAALSFASVKVSRR